MPQYTNILLRIKNTYLTKHVVFLVWVIHMQVYVFLCFIYFECSRLLDYITCHLIVSMTFLFVQVSGFIIKGLIISDNCLKLYSYICLVPILPLSSWLQLYMPSPNIALIKLVTVIYA